MNPQQSTLVKANYLLDGINDNDSVFMGSQSGAKPSFKCSQSSSIAFLPDGSKIKNTIPYLSSRFEIYGLWGITRLFYLVRSSYLEERAESNADYRTGRFTNDSIGV